MASGDFTANTDNEHIGMPYVPDTSKGSSVAITSYFLSIYCLLLFKLACDRLN